MIKINQSIFLTSNTPLQFPKAQTDDEAREAQIALEKRVKTYFFDVEIPTKDLVKCKACPKCAAGWYLSNADLAKAELSPADMSVLVAAGLAPDAAAASPPPGLAPAAAAASPPPAQPAAPAQPRPSTPIDSIDQLNQKFLQLKQSVCFNNFCFDKD